MGKLTGMIILFCFFFLQMTAIAIGQTVPDAMPLPPAEAPWWTEMIGNFLTGFPEINGWLMAVMGLIMGLLRVTSEFLMFLHKKTETEADDKILAKVNTALKWSAAATAWFGAGKPKSLEKKPEDK